MFEEFRDVQEAARYHCLPVATWSYPRGRVMKDARSPETFAYATRIALELGADVVKVEWPRSQAAMARAVEAAAGTDVVLSGKSKPSDYDRAMSVADELDVGAVRINGVSRQGTDDIPFGGNGDSGIGRERLNTAVHELVRRKSVVLRDARESYLSDDRPPAPRPTTDVLKQIRAEPFTYN
jgi:hypothetical protein